MEDIKIYCDHMNNFIFQLFTFLVLFLLVSLMEVSSLPNPGHMIIPYYRKQKLEREQREKNRYRKACLDLGPSDAINCHEFYKSRQWNAAKVSKNNNILSMVAALIALTFSKLIL